MLLAWGAGQSSLASCCLTHTLVVVVTKQLISEQAKVTLAGFMVLRDGAAGPLWPGSSPFFVRRTFIEVPTPIVGGKAHYVSIQIDPHQQPK